MHLLALELFTFDSAWSKGVERFFKNVKAKNILINQQQQHIPVHCLNSQQQMAASSLTKTHSAIWWTQLYTPGQATYSIKFA
jgi:hypothetical protein